MSGLDEKCKYCHGEGVVADYVGLHMSCVAVECDRCKGTGHASVTPADVGEEPVAWVSEGQLHAMPPDRDEDSASGRYLPMRRSAGGNFQFPLYSATALERVVRDRDEARRQLGELLAIVHRDGGHYQSLHGDEKAVADAHLVWGELISQAESNMTGVTK